MRPISGDGTGDVVVVDNAPDLRNSDFTITAWVRIGNGDPRFHAVVSKHESGFLNGFILGIGKFPHTTRDHVANFNMSSHPNQTVEGTTPINDGRWHLLAVSYSFATKRADLYVDGNLEGSKSGLTIVHNPLAPFLIGGLASQLPQHGSPIPFGIFEGKLDDIRVFDRELSAADIQRLYDKKWRFGLAGQHPVGARRVRASITSEHGNAAGLQ